MVKPGRLGIPLLGALLLFYPAAVFYGLQHGSARLVGLLLGIVVVARWWLLRGLGDNSEPGDKKTGAAGLMPVLLAGLACALVAVLANSGAALRLLPVLISLIMLATFGYTLWRPPTMIERFARALDGELPPAGIAYTRRVTQVWCLFFIVNAAVALYTALFASIATWTLYNGLISYGLMGLLFAGEWLLRQYLLRTGVLKKAQRKEGAAP